MCIPLPDIPTHTIMILSSQNKPVCRFLHTGFIKCSAQISGWSLITSLNCRPSLSAALRHMIMRPIKISK